MPPSFSLAETLAALLVSIVCCEDPRVTTSATWTSAWNALERQLQHELTLTWQPDGPVVLAVDSEKGGVGKSSVTSGIAAVAAANNLKVLVGDLDPRRTVTEELGAEDGEYSVNDLLFEDRDADPDDLPELSGLAAEALCPSGPAWSDLVQVLPAERALANRETDNTTPDLEHRLRIALEGVADKFDLVVLDLPPRAGGKLVGAGLLAATHVVFPATLNEDGQIGVRDAMRTVKFMSRTNPNNLRKVGVLRNIVDRRTKLGATYDERFAEEFGDQVLPFVVPKRVIREEARAACVPLTSAQGPDARDLINGYTHLLTAVGAGRVA